MQKKKDTDFQKSAALIRASFKRLFETLLEQTADRIYIKDTKGRFVFASDALARTHGLKHRSEIEGMTDHDFFDPESAKSFFAQEQEILHSGKSVINQVRRETWKYGPITWSSTSKVPLRLESGLPIGILGISRDVTEEYLNKEQLRKANETMLADYASAAKVQQVMIPGNIPTVSGIKIAYVWKPMSAVGGDIISFPLNPQKVLLFFMADVCGHGVQAAFYTILLKYITSQAAKKYSEDPQKVLNMVNKNISNQISSGFITGIAGHFSEQSEDGSCDLHLSHAGHPFLMISRKNNTKVELVNVPGSMVMGLPGCEAAETVKLNLKPGDRVFTFTDGVIEADNQDEEEFGIQRLKTIVEKNCSTLPLQKTLDTIYSCVMDYTGSSKQQDDITLLAFEITEKG